MIRARYRRIVLFFTRVIFNLILWEVFFPQIGLRRWSQSTRSDRLHAIAAQFRSLAIQMGGVLIKVGQFLSARVDVLPNEITNELSGLQDEVPEEDFDSIRQVVESEFGIPLEEKFVEFNPIPEAAASLGQVHSAKIYPQFPGIDGSAFSTPMEADQVESLDVVVKVQRPNIERIIATDLAALRAVGEWLRHYPPINRRANVLALLDEFTRILYEEIDYLAEGRNAEIFAANFKYRPSVRVPIVVWTHTTQRVLTLEDVRAIKITDYDAITNAGVDRTEVADRLFQAYLQQIFEDGFFHADPHPGNLFVSPLPSLPEEGAPDGYKLDWLLTFVDFGMVGRMPSHMLAGMREAVIAIGTQDAARLVKSYQILGVLLPEADLSLLEKAEAKAFERFWGKSMSELTHISRQEILEFTREFRQLIYNMPFQVPQDMILLGRTVGILSGMCTGLDPDFNVWEGLAPFARKLIAEETVFGLKAWTKELGTLAHSVLVFPTRMVALAAKMDRGDLEVRVPQLSAQVDNLTRAVQRLANVLVFAGLLVGGVQLYLAGEVKFAILLLAGAGLALVWMIFSR